MEIITHTESSSVTNNTKPSSTNSNNSPRHGGVGKAVRRRSRASKKTPITLLNADAASFRAVVQQFTGCHTTQGKFPGAHRGPINLNFGFVDEDNYYDYDNLDSWINERVPKTNLTPVSPHDNLDSWVNEGVSKTNLAPVSIQDNLDSVFGEGYNGNYGLPGFPENRYREKRETVTVSGSCSSTLGSSTVSDASLDLDGLDFDSVAFHDLVDDFPLLMGEDWNEYSSF